MQAMTEKWTTVFDLFWRKKNFDWYSFRSSNHTLKKVLREISKKFKTICSDILPLYFYSFIGTFFNVWLDASLEKLIIESLPTYYFISKYFFHKKMIWILWFLDFQAIATYAALHIYGKKLYSCNRSNWLISLKSTRYFRVLLIYFGSYIRSQKKNF